MVDGTVNTHLLPFFDGRPQHWMVLDGYPRKNFIFFASTCWHCHGNERTQTCIDAAQAAQHRKAHALIFFINCRLSLLIAGMQDEQFVSKGQLQLKCSLQQLKPSSPTPS
jgi:hypothetical protein